MTRTRLQVIPGPAMGRTPILSTSGGRINSGIVPARCARCGSRQTESMMTMHHATCDVDEWFRCHECRHVFAAACTGEA